MRTRIRSHGASGGTFVSKVGSFIGSQDRTATRQISKCEDEPGQRNLNFYVSHAWHSSPAITYTRPDGQKSLKNFPMSLWQTPLALAPLSDPGRSSNADYAVLTVARTNPSRAKVELPVSLFELRELPMLVRNNGLTLIRRIGTNNLRYYFGVLPLMNDLAALLNFAESVKKRAELLKKFRDQGSITRKVHLYSGHVGDYPNTAVQANSTPPTANVTYLLRSRVTMRTVWGYVTWTPSDSFMEMMQTDEAIIQQARTIILGLRVDFASLWEALPWSWLADWYGNIGDWLQANRHVVPIYPGIPAICETIRTEYNYLSQNNGFGMPPFYHTNTHVTVSKSRSKVSAAFPSANLPLLTPRQALILPSIAAVKGFK